MPGMETEGGFWRAAARKAAIAVLLPHRPDECRGVSNRRRMMIASRSFAGLLLAAFCGSALSSTDLGVEGTRFTLNGQPAFLLGCSYYGGLGAPKDFVRQDLDDLRRHGFNWVRVWATWSAYDHRISAVDREGAGREPFLAHLQWLIAECDQRGMVVDVTLSRGTELPDMASHRRAVETLVLGMKDRRNWYLDLGNERDVGDARFVSIAELSALRELVRQLDPQRLVTASFGGHDLTGEDVRAAVAGVKVDFLCPHRPRHAQSPAETREQTVRILELARRAGRVVPVHYQEPFRRGYTRWQPVAEDYLTDLKGTAAGGGAGWCFHNGGQRGQPDERPRRSFDLREGRLLDQLDDEEKQVIQRAREELDAVRRGP